MDITSIGLQRFRKYMRRIINLYLELDKTIDSDTRARLEDILTWDYTKFRSAVEWIWANVDFYKEENRLVFKGWYIDGKLGKDIAKELGVSVSRIMQRKNRVSRIMSTRDNMYGAFNLPGLRRIFE